MEDIFIDKLNERSTSDRQMMDEAMRNLQGMVSRQKKAKGAEETEDDSRLLHRRLPNRELTVRDLLTFVWESFDKKDVFFVLLASLVVTLLAMLGPFLNKQIFDDIIPSGATQNVLPIAIILVATGIGSLMFGVTRSLLLARLHDKIDVSVQSAMMARTYSMPPTFFRQFSSGDLSNRVGAVSRICNLLSDNIVSSLLTIIFSLMYFYQVFVYAKDLMGLCLLLMGANLALIVFSYWFNARFQRKLLPLQTKLHGIMFGILSGIQKVKSSGSETRAFARWAKAYSEADPNQANRPLFISLMPACSLLISLGGTALLYNAAVNSGVSLSDYIAFNMAYGQVSGAVSAIAGILPTIVMFKPLYELAKPLLETCPEIEEDTQDVDDVTGRIEVHHLSFRYGPTSPYIFEDLNLTIEPGEYVAFVGASGCGKSTLVRLLLGFEKPESGTIFYDHYNLAKINKQQLRQKMIGTILQDGKLFGGSIFQNITITHPLATMNEAWEAARMADVLDDIQEMPMGMHTAINDNGTGVSGGQRQRILIARALIGKPRILFMDEATSALDNIRQDRVARNIASTQCTRICVAHRLSTIKDCDRILYFEGGKVVEEGSYEQLMQLQGKFYNLCKRQIQ